MSKIEELFIQYDVEIQVIHHIWYKDKEEEKIAYSREQFEQIKNINPNVYITGESNEPVTKFILSAEKQQKLAKLILQSPKVNAMEECFDNGKFILDVYINEFKPDGKYVVRHGIDKDYVSAFAELVTNLKKYIQNEKVKEILEQCN